MSTLARFSLRFLGSGMPELAVVRFAGREALNELGEFEIVAVLDDDGAVESAFLGAQALVALACGESPRLFAGIVTAVAWVGRDANLRQVLALTLAPRAFLLTKRTQSRIFHEETVPAILARICREHAVPFALKLERSYRVREYCVQYEESDWEFFTRLAAEESIAFWFEPPTNGDAELLVLADAALAYKPIGEKAELRFRYDIDGALALEDDMVTDFRARHALETAAFAMRDYDFERPTLDLAARTELEGAAHPLGAAAALERYEHHGDFETTDVSRATAAARLDQVRCRVATAEGRSACSRLAPGHTFTLVEHDLALLDRGWVVTAVSHRGTSGRSDGREPGYENRFEAVPSGTPYLPPRPPRRVRQTNETALVVGPPGKEIHCDAWGRVEVQFHWDREGVRDGAHSCFLRVAQAWAGPGFGHHFIPRIGMEVLVGFVGGDPDRPLVVGCLANAHNPPQFQLPAQPTKSGIRTRSTPGGRGGSELTFDDLAGSEQLYLRAERNLDEDVGLDRTLRVARDTRETVGRDARSIVTRHRREETDGDRIALVRGSCTTNVAACDYVTVGGRRTTHVAGGEAWRVGGECVGEVEGGRTIRVRGDDTTTIGGACAVAVTGDLSLQVGGAARTTFSKPFSLNALQGIALSVGHSRKPASAKASLSGELVLRGAGIIELASDKEIRLRVGKTALVLAPDGIRIEGAKVAVAGKAIELHGEKAEVLIDQAVAIRGDTFTAASKDQAILALAEDARLDGKAVKLAPGLADERKKRAERAEQAEELDKLTIHLFDLAGERIENAPFEVTCPGYCDTGVAPDGTVEVPAFPDVEKVGVRWGRPPEVREDAAAEPYEFQMEVYLTTDVADEAEALRRKLSNLGHHGADLPAAIRHYQASVGAERTGAAADVRADVAIRHDVASPANLEANEHPL